jgi:hypothetical protein
LDTPLDTIACAAARHPRVRGASRTEAVAGFLAGGGLLPVLGDLLADLGR